MSRVINPDSVGKLRTQLIKGIVLSIRELARQSETGAETRDIAAFIALALKSISDGIDASVTAWEKRDYWIKADKFRMEWIWSGPAAEKMRIAVLTEDWATIAILSAQIAQKFSKIQVSGNHRLGRPWVGSYEKLIAK
jgi:hypothetical protein